MTSQQLSVKVAINSWRQVVERADKIFSNLHRRPTFERAGTRKEPSHLSLGASHRYSRRDVFDSGFRTAAAPRTGCHLRLQSRQDSHTAPFCGRAKKILGRSER